MRYYRKPALTIEAFDAADLITVSGPAQWDGGIKDDWAGAPPEIEYVNDLTVENPSGAFNQEVTGGNPVQEALNTLYENFLNRF